MLWGYFFTDESRERLESFLPSLEKEGYRFVNLFVPERDEGVEPYFLLRICARLKTGASIKGYAECAVPRYPSPV